MAQGAEIVIAIGNGASVSQLEVERLFGSVFDQEHFLVVRFPDGQNGGQNKRAAAMLAELWKLYPEAEVVVAIQIVEPKMGYDTLLYYQKQGEDPSAAISFKDSSVILRVLKKLAQETGL